ncbi:hypothetical protein RFI_03493 [Reticulomyxa filosa]|uniref:NACHT domain-containing protein n=1 Tax=Reticulomyxa filosa TaxID=46433 RepID=X6P7J8_RETFI|nr:hypothetical protein RFI_03493 [Reticulomyxa filosa]|eukprot:ETO33612.1 hypothetical protein RFI_03493 [Reticulomyxa filosa]
MYIYVYIHIYIYILRNVQITNEQFLKQERSDRAKTENKVKLSRLRKESELAEIGEIQAGINLQGNCSNVDCLASKAKLLVWVNLGFANVAFVSNKTAFPCPDCNKPTVESIAKAVFYNSEHSISASDDGLLVQDNHYQCLYFIRPGISYELKARKIRQHATSLENLRDKSENAMASLEMKNLIIELEKYEITVVKPPKLKDNQRLSEKIRADYDGDFNQAFDIGRFTILCDNPTKLQTAVAVMKKAEQFNLIVSEDKNFFDKQSKTHHRFHNIKLYVPKHDVYIEMQATLKHFTTLEGYAVIENPKLSHLLYEIVRAWRPDQSQQKQQEQQLKYASDEALIRINDIICEWIDEKEIQKIANRYKSHVEVGVLRPPQLRQKDPMEIANSKSLQMTKFAYDQLCNFAPEKMKGKAIHVVLFEFYKKHIIGEQNPATRHDVSLILQTSRVQEVEEDIAMAQALDTYIPLQANHYPYTDNDNKDCGFDCHQHVMEFLENKSDQTEVLVMQGISGSGKSLFCRYLEETLWRGYANGSVHVMPVYISLPKCYSQLDEQEIISQALQMKRIQMEMVDTIREDIPFVFIMDGFDEVFDAYNKKTTDKHFFDRFNLNQWNAKVLLTCRSNVLDEDEIKATLIGSSQYVRTTVIHLWPFSNQQMGLYIEKFVKIQKRNKKRENWTPRQYEQTLRKYPNLHKMVQEPFLLRLILSALPILIKQHHVGANISRAQVYEVFIEQWLDVHIETICTKLTELRIQTNPKKMKQSFRKYCEELAFDMFLQGNQIAIENETMNENETLITKPDPQMELKENHIVAKRNEMITNDIAVNAVIASKKFDCWEKYFTGDSVTKYLLRRIGNNQYTFLHKSCQEYFAAQKIIRDIVSWKSDSEINGTVDTLSNNEFQQYFEKDAHKLAMNCKLLNEESGIIRFIAERVHEKNPFFINLQSRLFRIIQSSKKNEQTCIAAANAATVLNSAKVNMHYKDWSDIKIPHAILDYAFLEGTTFANANLERVSLAQAFLNKTNFQNATMTGVYFGEYPFLLGHSGWITGAQFSPDGKFIVSHSTDGTIRIWDVLSGRQAKNWKDIPAL